jgi:uncharacterized heparinase superfamily protein
MRPSKWSRLGANLRPRERVGQTMRAVDRAGRELVARVRRSRLSQWPERRTAGEELLMAPPDLRVPDPSFVEELEAGALGLAGEIAHLRGVSPFNFEPPSEAWAREFYGFGWLRHMEAMRTPDVEAIARDLLADWLRRGRKGTAQAWTADVVGRRVISWLAHSGLLLDGSDRSFYEAVMRSLRRQVADLSASWANAPPGQPRLMALIAMVLADLCIAGHERQLARSQKQLVAELERQVLPDGSHVTRNAAIGVELLLDLLPLRQCFLVRSLPPPPELLTAIDRMMCQLRHVRLGDGALARFNGVGRCDQDALAIVLAYDKGRCAPLPALASPSGYARLERGSTIVVMDAGIPPPPAVGEMAHAGCLSFELSASNVPLLVNNGAPRLTDARLRAVARATASHNTLCLNEQSSSQLAVRGASAAGSPIRHPDNVTCKVEESGNDLLLEASHDGYVERWGLIHRRALALAGDGSRLEGVDCLVPAKGVLRFSWDLPFAIHFHCHPEVEVRPGASPDTADLLTGSGEHWRMTAANAMLSVEESLHCAGMAGAMPAQQVVLRGACHGEAQVSWVIERMAPGNLPVRQSQAAARSLGERLAETVDANAATSFGTWRLED